MKKIIVLLTFIFGISSTSVFSKNNLYEKIDLFGEVLENIKEDYVDDVDQAEMMDSAINGVLQSLDPYSAYMSPELFKEMQTDTSGEFGGLGIEIGMEAGVVKVISPIDGTPAEEAGIKSATFQVDAPYAYGTLSVEQGTHRLVRISPFDNQGRRQTSFARVEVLPITEQTDHIDIPESDIRVDVFRSSGPGGQSVNTTDSAVRITHVPTGIVVSCQNEKSQIQNRAAAMRVLQSRLLELRRQEEKAEMDALKGDASGSWGDQMRSYVLHPYQMVKDLRTGTETGNTANVLDGEIDDFVESGIRWRRTETVAE